MANNPAKSEPEDEPVDEKLDGITDEEVEEWFEAEEDEDEEGEATADVIEDELDQKYARAQIQIVRSTIDFTLHTLRQSLKDPLYINLSPTYQRRTRWDRKRRSLLIESFLMNIPVPPIFLYENQYNQYEAMDGRQRLETIRDFLDNAFPLSGLEFFPELKGKRFNDLNPTLQRGLLRRSITAIVLLAETTRPENPEHDVRMILFRRLNTGGARLNPQEMRNALYPGTFNTMLVETARTKPFTTIWRIPQKTRDEKEKVPKELSKNALYRTMADAELVLRFIAIKETVELNLSGSMRRLLDNCIARHAKDSAHQINRMTQEFQTCITLLDNTFDHQPFVLPRTRRPSRNLYDALMVALSLHPECDIVADKENVQTRLTDALDDPQKYSTLTGHANTVDAIRERVKIAERVLTGEEM